MIANNNPQIWIDKEMLSIYCLNINQKYVLTKKNIQALFKLYVYLYLRVGVIVPCHLPQYIVHVRRQCSLFLEIISGVCIRHGKLVWGWGGMQQHASCWLGEDRCMLGG